MAVIRSSTSCSCHPNHVNDRRVAEKQTPGSFAITSCQCLLRYHPTRTLIAKKIPICPGGCQLLGETQRQVPSTHEGRMWDQAGERQEAKTVVPDYARSTPTVTNANATNIACAQVHSVTFAWEKPNDKRENFVWNSS